MKIAILSDLHLGYDRFADDAYTQAKEAVEKACTSADALLIPGDVFDNRNPKPEVIAQAINIFRGAARREWTAKVSGFESTSGTERFTDVPIVAIPGTHERTSEGKENALSLLALAGLIVDASESRVTITKGMENTAKAERVCVWGLGGVSEERVRESLNTLRPTPVAGSFNIFMFHQSTYELLPFSEEFIHEDELPGGFDLYVDGHIHSRQERQVKGKKFLIPGSTVLTQLKDGEQEPKGFILFDTADGSHSFVKIRSRPFVCRTIETKDAKPASVAAECERALKEIIADHSDTKPIIRLVMKGKIASGFTNADISVRHVASKYSDKAFIEIDMSGLKNEDDEKGIMEIHENKIDGLSIKEAGVRFFIENLKKQGFDSSIDIHRLFEILSSSSKKEKMLKEANEMLLG